MSKPNLPQAYSVRMSWLAPERPLGWPWTTSNQCDIRVMENVERSLNLGCTWMYNECKAKRLMPSLEFSRKAGESTSGHYPLNTAYFPFISMVLDATKTWWKYWMSNSSSIVWLAESTDVIQAEHMSEWHELGTLNTSESGMLCSQFLNTCHGQIVICISLCQKCLKLFSIIC